MKNKNQKIRFDSLWSMFILKVIEMFYHIHQRFLDKCKINF